MSFDPRSPSDAADAADLNDHRTGWLKAWDMHDAVFDPSRPGGCENCGEDEFSPCAEAFEVTGRLLCSLCAEDALSEGEADVDAAEAGDQ